MLRALEHAVDRVVVADRRRDGLGPVDHDLRGVRVPEGRHQPGALRLGPAQALDPLDVDSRPGAQMVEQLRPRGRALRRRVDEVLDAKFGMQ